MNAEELFTRCPTCRTVFRTDEERLSLQSGRVRCGLCRMVFDGRAHRVEVVVDDGGMAAVHARQPEEALVPVVAPPAPASGTVVATRAATTDNDRSAPSEAPQPAPATVFPAISLDPVSITMAPSTVAPARWPASIAGPSITTHPVTIQPLWSDTETLAPSMAAGARGGAHAASDPIVMPEWEGPTPPPRAGARWAYGVVAFLLLAVLAGQALFHFRNALAADMPLARPHLVTLCAAIGCKIEPLRNRDEIAIESHDLQADPAHQGLLILQATLRNQSGHALAFPHLDLELDDNAGQPIVRRVFAPVDYAGGAADFARGIPANAEWNVKLFLDASSVSAGNYRLYHFYP